MPTYSEWVSFGALGLSVVSLGWQVARGIGEKPRLYVSHEEMMHFEPHRNGAVTYQFTIAVTNYGGSAVTVTDAHWETENDRGLNNLYGGTSGADWSVTGPGLPHRLDKNDRAEWTVSEPYMSRFDEHERLRAIVTVARRPRLLLFRGTSGVQQLKARGWMTLPTFGLTTGEVIQMMQKEPG